MSKYAESDITAIKKKIDILEYLESRGFSLQSSGPVSYKMACPVHKERTPSFHVNLEYQHFNCFGCGIKGDIISLVQELDKLNFPSAVQELAELAGVQLTGIEDDPDARKRKKLRKLLDETSEWYRYNYENLPESHLGKINFIERNLLDQSLKDETVGWAPSGGLTNFLTQKGYEKQDMVDAGLLKQNDDGTYREAFRSRIIWALEDVQGRTVGYSARHIMENDTGPKYLNTPQTLLYNKSKTLLGLSKAKKTVIQEQTVYIVEGQTDVMAMNAAGYENTVASCGTAFGTTHANMLMSLSKMGKGSERFKLVFCFDGDAAGVKAARSVFEANKDLHLHSYVASMVTPLGEPTDPCDLRKLYGNEAVQHIVENTQVSMIEFILKNEFQSWETNTPEGQSGFITKAQEILALVDDKIQYNAYMRKVALWTGIPYDELLSMRVRPKPQQSRQKNEASPEIITPVTAEMNPFESKLLISLVKYPIETLTVFGKYKLNSTFFRQNGDLFNQILIAISEEKISQLIMDSSTVAAFLHDSLTFTSEPTEEIDSMTRMFLRYSLKVHMDYLNSQMNAMLATSTNEIEAFTHLLEEQQRTADYYDPDKRVTL